MLSGRKELEMDKEKTYQSLDDFSEDEIKKMKEKITKEKSRVSDTSRKREYKPRNRKEEIKLPAGEVGSDAHILMHNLKVSKIGEGAFNWNDNDEAIRRCEMYFQLCADDNAKPTVAGLALAFGIGRTSLWQHLNNGKETEVTNTLKKAYTLCETQMVDYMANGRINPVSGIFLLKNFHNYTDKQEVVVNTDQPLGDIADIETVKNKYDRLFGGYVDVEVVEADADIMPNDGPGTTEN